MNLGLKYILTYLYNIYPTLTAAAKAHNMTAGNAVHRCKSSRFPLWLYYNEDSVQLKRNIESELRDIDE